MGMYAFLLFRFVYSRRRIVHSKKWNQ